MTEKILTLGDYFSPLINAHVLVPQAFAEKLRHGK